MKELEIQKYLRGQSESIKDIMPELGNYELTEEDNLTVLEELGEEFGINISINPLYPELVVLNYDQIYSPKFHPIILECRSLVLEVGTWEVVSRSFDRFFNYGETDCGYNAAEMEAFEKMDGSLIGLFYYNKYGWMYRTRSMIMPKGSVNSMRVTWDKLIEEALGDKWAAYSKTNLTYDYYRCLTFIMELTSPDNRVVTRYNTREMTLLSIRNNLSGMYEPKLRDTLSTHFSWRVPRRWSFEHMSEYVSAAKGLPNLEEGFVIYCKNTGEPVCKVKNPAYISAHHLRGEGVLSPKHVINLLVVNEIDEYLSVFPEDASVVEPYVRAYFQMFAEAETMWALYGTIQDQKEFALKIKDSPVATLLFRKRNDREFRYTFSKASDNSKVNMVTKYIH